MVYNTETDMIIYETNDYSKFKVYESIYRHNKIIEYCTKTLQVLKDFKYYTSKTLIFQCCHGGLYNNPKAFDEWWNIVQQETFK